MKRPAKSGNSRPRNRWRLQDAKAHLSEVVRQAQQRGQQRVTLHGRDAVVVVRAEELNRLRRPISGRNIVAALATSPLAGVNFERMDRQVAGTGRKPVRGWLLLNTNVLSELRKPKPAAAVAQFVTTQPGEHGDGRWRRKRWPRHRQARSALARPRSRPLPAGNAGRGRSPCGDELSRAPALSSARLRETIVLDFVDPGGP